MNPPLPPVADRQSWFTPRRISFLFMALMLLLIGGLHMTTLLLTTLFSYFALRQFSGGRSKPVGIAIFTVVVIGMAYGLYFFSKQAYVAFPRITLDTIPAVVGFAEKQGIELPFTDYASLRQLALTEAREKFANIGRYAREAVFLLVYIVIGIVVAVSLFISAKLGVEDDSQTARDSLYALTVREIATRFVTFYRSFTIVMGAQILISVINTGLTAVFLFWAGFPYPMVLVACTFLCGLLPIIGNIISNTLITGVAFTISPKTALVALIFLITIHKMEYFLNSKIIGDRIKNPMWLTLLGLLLGEKLMGIPGMIFAPIVLHYIKVEASRARALEEPSPPPNAEDEHSDLLLRV
ncbi:MAG: AI-2E family transporter [Verrucomicrobiales bacterium]|nr:AI-2E family transporter [Verrucomicrobiales bacterium]